MQIKFELARIPEIIFGGGSIQRLPDIILTYGYRVILITGAMSFKQLDTFHFLINSFKEKSIQYSLIEISGEPTPADINSINREFSKKPVDVVVSIGGGSVVDAGKAVSAMLDKTDPVEAYLEGIGTKIHDGSKIPFIAIPTTAGTGSETTKNAVLSQVGENGYKRSIRHNNFVPNIALVDPELCLNCPPDVTAASGMDAFTQLLESYVSTNASPFTDVLAYSGIKLMKDNLVPAATTGAQEIEVRAAMSYAALLSGITLANAGLGIVHGLASSIGSYYNIPHGVICGTFVGAVTKLTIERLKDNKESGIHALEKYAQIGKLFSENNEEKLDYYCEVLVEKIEEWTKLLDIPKLNKYEFRESDLEKIVHVTGNKNNPVKLDHEDIKKIILWRT
jgi:alcohol dehydrogenase class IV